MCQAGLHLNRASPIAPWVSLGMTCSAMPAHRASWFTRVTATVASITSMPEMVARLALLRVEPRRKQGDGGRPLPEGEEQSLNILNVSKLFDAYASAVLYSPP